MIQEKTTEVFIKYETFTHISIFNKIYTENTTQQCSAVTKILKCLQTNDSIYNSCGHVY